MYSKIPVLHSYDNFNGDEVKVNTEVYSKDS